MRSRDLSKTGVKLSFPISERASARAEQLSYWENHRVKMAHCGELAVDPVTSHFLLEV